MQRDQEQRGQICAFTAGLYELKEYQKENIFDFLLSSSALLFNIYIERKKVYFFKEFRQTHGKDTF